MEALFASLTERFCLQALHRELARLIAYFRTRVYELAEPEALLKADLRIIDHSWNFVCTASAFLDW
jgi:regulator of sirC expression with transglutaminase-like and TPR domain